MAWQAGLHCILLFCKRLGLMMMRPPHTVQRLGPVISTQHRQTADTAQSWLCLDKRRLDKVSVKSWTAKPATPVVRMKQVASTLQDCAKLLLSAIFPSTPTHPYSLVCWSLSFPVQRPGLLLPASNSEAQLTNASMSPGTAEHALCCCK